MPAAPGDIEQRSFQIINAQLASVLPSDPAAAAIVRRVVHATADISFARSMRIHPDAATRGAATLAAGKPIVCDVRMLVAGITRVRSEVLCAIDNPQVAQLARQAVSTRAAAAMEFLADRLDGAIVAIGNAPTALWKILEIAKRGGPRPALVVGLPVGFVGAAESKQALLESDLCYVTNVGPRGGSPVAAAALNAIATHLAERSESNA
jgi:precorrin-8X/cobalt-precorrin-8 methylmutase